MKIHFLRRNGLVASAILVAFLITVSSVMLFYNRRVMENTVQTKASSEKILLRSSEIESHGLQEYDKNLRGFALSPTESFTGHMKVNVEACYKSADTLAKLLREQKAAMPLLQHQLDSLLQELPDVTATLKDYHAFGQYMADLVKKDSMDAFKKALAEDRGAAVWGIWFELHEKIGALEKTISQKAQAEYDMAVSRNAWIQVLLALLGLPTLYWMVKTVKTQEKNRGNLLQNLEQSNRQYLFHPGEQTQGDIIEASIGNLQKAAVFIKKISQNEEAQWDGLTEQNKPLNQDNLVGELLGMQRRMKQVREEDRKRNWTNEGLNHLGEILRRENDTNKLAERVLAELVKYLGANQGALFVVDDTDANRACLELKAAYAYNRKKYLNKQIAPGQGLAGQAWQENETIYLREIPQDYVRITSGLGDATPNNLLIVPLKHDANTQGVVEIASFKLFEPYEIAFVEKIAESIAVSFASAKIAERTSRLLAESQQMAEMMRAQEEEMRQNMEEMVATQEEMARKEQEYLQRIAELEARQFANA
ncbi:MAG: GAF domain-containing protein [Cytophagales bacterium]|nr:GAF domain-containing protein [Cytophagales bacterium]